MLMVMIKVCLYGECVLSNPVGLSAGDYGPYIPRQTM